MGPQNVSSIVRTQNTFLFCISPLLHILTFTQYALVISLQKFFFWRFQSKNWFVAIYMCLVNMTLEFLLIF